MNHTATSGLFTFQGYRQRLSFLGAALIQFFVFFVVIFVSASMSFVALVNNPVTLTLATLISVIVLLLAIVLSFWISVCISFQRMRDIGFSELTQIIYFLACFIPIIGGFLALGLFLVKGEGKANGQYTGSRIEPSFN